MREALEILLARPGQGQHHIGGRLSDMWALVDDQEKFNEARSQHLREQQSRLVLVFVLMKSNPATRFLTAPFGFWRRWRP